MIERKFKYGDLVRILGTPFFCNVEATVVGYEDHYSRYQVVFMSPIAHGGVRTFAEDELELVPKKRPLPK